jgi:hypothetical protein
MNGAIEVQWIQKINEIMSAAISYPSIIILNVNAKII